MLVQFDKEDSENLVLTFDNTSEDAEQMKDFISWLKASDLEFSKLKMKMPGFNEKVTNIIVKKRSRSGAIVEPLQSVQVYEEPAFEEQESIKTKKNNVVRR